MDCSDYKIPKKKQEINFWACLPLDFLLLILDKLHYTDQVRFRAVCKNWRVPEQLIRCSSSLPWLFSNIPDKYPLTCELLDPYSKKVYKVPNSIEKLSPPLGYTTVHATKHGWLLLGRERSLFLHNPFTNKIISSLPNLNFNYKAATITTSPASSECEVLVVWTVPLLNSKYGHILKISKYCLTRDIVWNTEHLGMTSEELLSVQFLEGSIYCLFENWVLKRYKLADKSWKSLTTSSPSDYSPLCSIIKCWLIKKGEDLLVACADYITSVKRWMIFKFDFIEMRWQVVKRSLTGCAFFISDRIAFWVPLKDGDGNKIEDCQVFYLDDRRSAGYGFGYWFNCSSLKANWTTQSRDYSWITNRPYSNFTFIELPSDRNKLFS